MKPVLLVLLLTACTVRATADDAEVSDAGGSCIETIYSRFFPAQIGGPFVISENPVKHRQDPAWSSTGAAELMGSFPISYQAGDRIVGLALDAWWNRVEFPGIRAIQVRYTPDMDSSPIILASGSDVARQGWKTIALTEHQFAGVELAPYGQLWVEIEFALLNYRIGYATAIFERPCRR